MLGLWHKGGRQPCSGQPSAATEGGRQPCSGQPSAGHKADLAPAHLSRVQQMVTPQKIRTRDNIPSTALSQF